MKKALITILSIIMLLTTSIGLMGCLNNENNETTEIPEISSEINDFYYVASANGYVVTGVKNENKKDLIVPEGVISIHDEAFKNCHTFTSIVLPSSLKEIGLNAFRNCINLKEVIFAENSTLTTISDFAFSECKSLTQIFIPKSVKTMGAIVFENSSVAIIKAEIQSTDKPLTWHESWNLYNNPIIWDCNNNKVANNGNQYVVNDGIIYSISNNQARVVKQGYNLEIANIANSIMVNGINVPVIAINDGAFENCEGLLELYIPKSVYVIGSNVIMGARAVVCYIESNVAPAGSQINQNWNKNANYGTGYDLENTAPLVLDYKNNTSKIASDGKVYIHKDKLLYCLNLSKGEATITIQSFALKEASFVDYVEYNGKNYPVTSTEKSVFHGSLNLEKITLPNTLKSIDWYFLYGAKNVKELFIPKSVESIQKCTFGFMTRLESIVFEKGSKIKNIPTDSMRGLVAVETLVLPDSLESISDSAIEISALTYVVFPETLTSLGVKSLTATKRIDICFTTTELSFTEAQLKSAFNITSGALDQSIYNVLLYRDTKPSVDAYKYWRYVNGVPKSWNKN